MSKFTHQYWVEKFVIKWKGYAHNSRFLVRLFIKQLKKTFQIYKFSCEKKQFVKKFAVDFPRCFQISRKLEIISNWSKFDRITFLNDQKYLDKFEELEKNFERIRGWITKFRKNIITSWNFTSKSKFSRLRI